MGKCTAATCYGKQLHFVYEEQERKEIWGEAPESKNILRLVAQTTAMVCATIFL
jgi:hypothetical protein